MSTTQASSEQQVERPSALKKTNRSAGEFLEASPSGSPVQNRPEKAAKTDTDTELDVLSATPAVGPSAALLPALASAASSGAGLSGPAAAAPSAPAGFVTAGSDLAVANPLLAGLSGAALAGAAGTFPAAFGAVPGASAAAGLGGVVPSGLGALLAAGGASALGFPPGFGGDVPPFPFATPVQQPSLAEVLSAVQRGNQEAEKRHEAMQAHILALQKEISELKAEMVTKQIFANLETRVLKLEENRSFTYPT